MLATLSALIDETGATATDQAVLRKLSRLLVAADRAVKQRLNRPDLEESTAAELYDPARQIVLRRYPVASVTDVRVDPLRVFGTDTIVASTTYELERDGDAGLLRWLAGPASADWLGWWGGGGYGYGDYGGGDYGCGAAGGGCPRHARSTVRINYTAGYAEDAVPPDLARAAVLLAARWYARGAITAAASGAGSSGGAVKSVRRGQSQVQYMSAAESGIVALVGATGDEWAGIDDLLAPYREVPVG